MASEVSAVKIFCVLFFQSQSKFFQAENKKKQLEISVDYVFPKLKQKEEDKRRRNNTLIKLNDLFYIS